METWIELLRLCQLLRQRKLHRHKGKPKTLSSKDFESSPTCAASRFPPPVIVTTPLIIPKVCNNSNPNFEGAFCSGGDILSVQSKGKKPNQTKLWVLLQNQTAHFLLTMCKTVQVWRCISNCCKYFVVLNSVFYLEDNVCFIEVIVCLSFFQFLVFKR